MKNLVKWVALRREGFQEVIVLNYRQQNTQKMPRSQSISINARIKDISKGFTAKHLTLITPWELVCYIS